MTENNLDYGRMPYMSNATTYTEFMDEVTDQAIISQGAVYSPIESKKPEEASDYGNMMYLFNSNLQNLSGLEVPTLDDPYVTSTGIVPIPATISMQLTLMPMLSSDDGYAWNTGGGTGFSNTAVYCNIGGLPIGYNNYTFVRFPNVEIEQGTLIKSAFWMVVDPDSDALGSDPMVPMYFNNVGDAVTPFDYASTVALLRTNSSVSWPLPPFTSGVPYTSPNLKVPLQEVILRPDWKKGNALMLLVWPGTSCVRSTASADNTSFPRSKLIVTI
jgi:hypothetical protein